MGKRLWKRTRSVYSLLALDWSIVRDNLGESVCDIVTVLGIALADAGEILNLRTGSLFRVESGHGFCIWGYALELVSSRRVLGRGSCVNGPTALSSGPRFGSRPHIATSLLSSITLNGHRLAALLKILPPWTRVTFSVDCLQCYHFPEVIPSFGTTVIFGNLQHSESRGFLSVWPIIWSNLMILLTIIGRSRKLTTLFFSI